MSKLTVTGECAKCRKVGNANTILLCPLHAAASDLKAELDDLTNAVQNCAASGTIKGKGVNYLLRIISDYTAIAKAEGKDMVKA